MEKNQDKGFTLVELLIVIVILGILATVTVFAVRGITDKGQENACSVEQRTLDTAIEAFYAQNQADPAVVTTVITDGVTTAGLVPTYLKDAPDDTKFAFYAVGATVPASTTDPVVAEHDATSAEFLAIGVCGGSDAISTPE